MKCAYAVFQKAGIISTRAKSLRKCICGNICYISEMLHSFSSPFLFHLSTKNLYVSLIIIADKEAHSGKSIKRSKKLKNTVPSLAAYLYWVSIVLIYGGKIFYVEKQLGRAIFFSGYEIIAGIIFTPDIPFVFYFFMTAGNFTLPGALLTVLSREFINSGINFSSIFQY